MKPGGQRDSPQLRRLSWPPRPSGNHAWRLPSPNSFLFCPHTVSDVVDSLVMKAEPSVIRNIQMLFYRGSCSPQYPIPNEAQPGDPNLLWDCSLRREGKGRRVSESNNYVIVPNLELSCQEKNSKKIQRNAKRRYSTSFQKKFKGMRRGDTQHHQKTALRLSNNV